jgi:RNA polymerase sigma factor (sigma-70 family)
MAQQHLTASQERDLVVAAEAGDADACRNLVAAFLPSIAALAFRFPIGADVELQELLQEGVVGLLFATHRYDPRRKTPFWAYASFWVRKAMQELVAELGRPVALSDRAVRALAHIRTARGEHRLTHGSEPTNDELSHATGFTRAQIESLQATERVPRSMEAHLIAADRTATVGDAIADPAAEREYERVLDEMELRELRDLAGRLEQREQTVIRARYGLGQPPQTLSQIGGTLGVSAERVRQIERNALSKLREALA